MDWKWNELTVDWMWWKCDEKLELWTGFGLSIMDGIIRHHFLKWWSRFGFMLDLRYLLNNKMLISSPVCCSLTILKSHFQHPIKIGFSKKRRRIIRIHPNQSIQHPILHFNFNSFYFILKKTLISVMKHKLQLWGAHSNLFFLFYLFHSFTLLLVWYSQFFFILFYFKWKETFFLFRQKMKKKEEEKILVWFPS